MNHLADETSPHLSQHVATIPSIGTCGAREAFELATALDRPLFISIGYSACHWCHVMAHESFEDPKVAEFLE